MGKSIVNAHSFKMDLGPPFALTPDSCWIQHLPAFTGMTVTLARAHAHARRQAGRQADGGACGQACTLA